MRWHRKPLRRAGNGPGETPPKLHKEPHRVGIVGTFDVENYGDLLFPVVAQAALGRRLNAVEVVPFSPNPQAAPAWPYDVFSTLDLPEVLPSLAALLIGGGQIIRFDTGYPIPTDPRVRLPVDYWLTPAALGALAGKPVIWNAIGAWTGSPAAPWYDELVKATLAASHFVGLRDEPSRDHLALLAPAADLHILPDTVFSLARLWPLARESVDFAAWRKSLDIRGRYVILQADQRLGPSRPAIDALITGSGVETTVLLPVCRCHGDASEGLPALPSGATVRSGWPAPRLLSEIIGRSEAVVASSLHACITAISYGVPVVRVPSFNVADRKFEMLDSFAGVAAVDRPAAVAAVLRRGRGPEPRALNYADRLDAYWDRVVDVVLNPQRHAASRSTALMLHWATSLFPIAAPAARSAGVQGEMTPDTPS
ncbi:MAG: polysaccharide pyruvyl transferase family protein [Planctomycetes bacterium]|nr:polysaccharide pyruvyl transferase family protein [Planctomycetota bacterium]